MTIELTELKLHSREGIIKTVEGIGVMDITKFEHAIVALTRTNKYGLDYRQYVGGVPQVTMLDGGGRKLEVFLDNGKVLEVYSPEFNNLTNPQVQNIKFHN